MELSPDTVKTLGVEPISKATGLSIRTIYRWAAEGIPGKGAIRDMRKSVVAQALEKVGGNAACVKAQRPVRAKAAKAKRARVAA